MNKLIMIMVVLCGLTYSTFSQGDSTQNGYVGKDPLGIVVDDVIAVVGEDLILDSEIQDQFLQLKYETEIPTDQEQMAKCQLLDQIILNKVLKTHALRDSLVVGPDEVEYQLEARLQQLISQLPSEEDFEDYYNKTVNQIKEQLRPLVLDALLAEKKRDEVISDVKVTPAEVKRFFYRIPEDQLKYYNAEVELAQIVMYPEASEESRVETLQTLKNIKDSILNGADFATFAQKYSDDKGSGKKGGDLGFFRKGQMVAEFEDVAFKMAPGELSRIVETDFGFHLIQVLERRGEAVHARHILLKPSIEDEKYVELKEEMDEIYDKIKNDSTYFFEYAVDLHSEDEQTKAMGGLLFNPKTGTSYFEIDELLEFNPEMYLAIDDLEEGEISQPVEFTDPFGRKAYRILYVQKQRDAHRMSLENDFEVIKKAALEMKQNERLYEWLGQATTDVFIAVDQEYRSCPNMPLWLKAVEAN